VARGPDTQSQHRLQGRIDPGNYRSIGVGEIDGSIFQPIGVILDI